MNDSCWRLPECLRENKDTEFVLPEDSCLGDLLTITSKVEKRKRMTISPFFERCDQPRKYEAEAKFVVNVAKFITIFNLEPCKIKALSKMTEMEIEYVSKYSFERILADTNRKPFSKFFSKSVCPIIAFIEKGLPPKPTFFLFIDEEESTGKCSIKVLNYEKLLHSVFVNLNPSQNMENFTRFLDSRHSRMQVAVVFHRISGKNVRSEILEVLLSRYEQVHYITINNRKSYWNGKEANIVYQETEMEDECIQRGNYNIKVPKGPENIRSSKKTLMSLKEAKWEEENQVVEKSLKFVGRENYSILSTHEISNECYSQIFKYYKNLKQTNKGVTDIIMSLRTSQEILRENELFVLFTGLLFNYVSVFDRMLSIPQEEVLISLLTVAINEQVEKIKIEKHQNAKNKNKKPAKIVGHFPQFLGKGGKACCVCEDKKKKKTKYKCQECSIKYTKDIPICLYHFGKFHDEMPRHLPKGVKTEVYENELKKIRSNRDDPSTYDIKIENGEEGSASLSTRYFHVMAKWEEKFSYVDSIIGKFARNINPEFPEIELPPSSNFINFLNPQMNFGFYYPPPPPPEELYPLKSEYNENYLPKIEESMEN